MDRLDREEVKKRIQAEVAAATIQELVGDMTDKCYKSCIPKPGSGLDNSERRCLGNCMDRFIDSFNLVTREFTQRVGSQMGEGD